VIALDATDPVLKKGDVEIGDWEGKDGSSLGDQTIEIVQCWCILGRHGIVFGIAVIVIPSTKNTGTRVSTQIGGHGTSL